MGKAIIVARHELLVVVGRLSYRIFTALPMVLGLLALIGLAIAGSLTREELPEERTPLGYVDQTGLFTGFHEQGQVVFTAYQDQQAGVQALVSEEIKALYIIPSDYLATGQVVRVVLERGGFDLEDSYRSYLENFLLDNMLSERLPPHILERSRNPALVSTVEVDSSGVPVQKALDPARMVFFFVMGGLVLLALMTNTGYFLQSLSEEKENRTMEVLLSSIKPEHLLVGKLLGLGAAGLLQMLLWVLSGLALLGIVALALGGLLDTLTHGASLQIGVPSPAMILVGLLYFLLSYAFFGSLFGAIGAVTTSQKEAQQITGFLVLPVFVPFWFMAPLLSNPESTLARVLSYVPFTTPVTSMLRLALDAMGPLDLAVSLGLLALGTVVSVFLTLRLFRAYLLMYGRRPTVREVLTTLARG